MNHSTQSSPACTASPGDSVSAAHSSAASKPPLTLVHPLLDSRLRFLGCSLITSTGRLLGLPTTTTLATAQVLLHRFLSSSSSSSSSPLRKHALRDIALAALFLACKVEETQVAVKHLLAVYHQVLNTWRSAARDLPAAAMDPIRPGSLEFTDLEHALLRSEMYLLKALGFDTHVDHAPDVYLWVVHFARALDLLPPASAPAVLQDAWNLANDAFRLPLALYLPPHVVAAACVHLAATRAARGVPNDWASVVADVHLDDLQWTVSQLASLDHIALPVDLPLTLDEMPAWTALDDNSLRQRLIPTDTYSVGDLEAAGKQRWIQELDRRMGQEEQQRLQAEEAKRAGPRARHAEPAPPKVDAAAVQAAVAKARAAAAAATARNQGRERRSDGESRRDRRERYGDPDRDRDLERDRDRDRHRRYPASDSRGRYAGESTTSSSSRGYRR